MNWEITTLALITKSLEDHLEARRTLSSMEEITHIQILTSASFSTLTDFTHALTNHAQAQSTLEDKNDQDLLSEFNQDLLLNPPQLVLQEDLPQEQLLVNKLKLLPKLQLKLQLKLLPKHQLKHQPKLLEEVAHWDMKNALDLALIDLAIELPLLKMVGVNLDLAKLVWSANLGWAIMSFAIGPKHP